MIQYYTNVAHTIVYRFNDGHPEYYDLPDKEWKHCPEFWDMTIGELDVDDLTEDEAHELIERLLAKREKRPSCSNGKAL